MHTMHTKRPRHIPLRPLALLTLAALLLTSCSTVRYAGVSRIRHYTVSHELLPQAFDGYRIAFASDFHLESKFKQRQLRGTVKALQAAAPDLLLLGGDYQEGCHYVEPLFAALAQATPPAGTYAVMGNNDYERCTHLIREAMERHGITLLEDSVAHVYRANDSIALWGANPYRGRYPTANRRTIPQPTTQSSQLTTQNALSTQSSNTSALSPQLTANGQSPTAYTVLLTHTPDYVEEPEATRAHLALAGHTHGGQVTLFGLYAPVTASKYGSRFRTRYTHSTQGTPIIISNGLGTSQRPIRLFAPTDIIVVTLKTVGSNAEL